MCDAIRFKDEPEIRSIREFQDRFNADAKNYGWDGDINYIDACMCELDLKKFFKDHPEFNFEWDCGEWFEL
jgi:hypothetical protein